MSVGKTSDDKTVSIFTGDGVTVHAKEDVIITCHGMPNLIGVQDAYGHYRIPLIQSHGQWQPCQPSNCAQAALHQAKSIYDLPSTEQAIKWLHAVYVFPVKSTWIKPSRGETSIDGHYSPPQMYSSITWKQLKHHRGTSTRPAQMFASPKAKAPVWGTPTYPTPWPQSVRHLHQSVRHQRNHLH